MKNHNNLFERFNQLTAPFLFRNFDMGGRRRLWLKLATLLKNGVPLLQALDNLRQLKKDLGQQTDPGTYALAAWRTAVNNGQRLHTVLPGWVSDEEVMLIAAGEQSERLVEVLYSTRELMLAKSKVRSTIMSGLAYPMFLTILLFAFLYYFSFSIVPAFTRSTHGTAFHGMALFEIHLAAFVRQWLWAAIAAFIGAILLFVFSLSRLDGPIRIWLDRRAPYSIYRVLHGNPFLTATAALVGSGVPVLSAVRQLQVGKEGWLKTRLSTCIRWMEAGKNMGESLALAGHGFPDVEVISDLQVYSKFGDFDEALLTTAREWLDLAVENIQSKMKVVFGASLLLLAMVIIVLVSGLIAIQIQYSQITQLPVH